MSEIERAIEYFERKIVKNDRACENYVALFAEEAKRQWIEIDRPIGELALKLLRAELEREKNEPMTIEEILDMNGKPVWCQTGDGYEGWALVIVDKYQDGGHYLYLFSDDLTRDGINECFEPDEDFINLKFSDDPDGHFGLHVLGWRAYRYEPKGEPNV